MVWDDDGPTPILKMSKTLRNMAAGITDRAGNPHRDNCHVIRSDQKAMFRPNDQVLAEPRTAGV
jgi:hypothetical protein